MKIIVLGTGTSTGVPQMGCSCEVCRSADERDKRLRASVLVECENGAEILIDCGPDFRQQMLRRPFHRLSGVLITHEHYDHVGGIDDLRPYSVFGDVSLYADANCSEHLMERLPYCFVEHKYPGVPQIHLNQLTPGKPFSIEGVEIMPLRIMHGRLPILGFRIGRFAYITDMKQCPDETLPLLEGIDTLIINGLRYEPHASHQTIPEAVTFAHKVGARRSFITHLSHQAGLHKDIEKSLPDDVRVAYDGLEISM